MHPDMLLHIRKLSRVVYYVTEEEDRFLVEFNQILQQNTKGKRKSEAWVFNAALGLVPIGTIIDDWHKRTHAPNTALGDIQRTLIHAFQSDAKSVIQFFIITDPERYFNGTDPHAERRVLNVIHQSCQDSEGTKVLIFVSNRLSLPPKFRRYVDVVQDQGLTDEQIDTLVASTCTGLRKDPPPRSIARHLRGLTAYEIDAAITLSVVMTHKTDTQRIDLKVISDYRRQRLQKSDLVTLVDTSKAGFDNLGGLEQFKAWAEENKVCWTEEGRKFGLEPPKGVLCVGVWGCGKSEAAKALGPCWGLPVVQLEMGKLRSPLVGNSEENMYRVTTMLEALAPCVVWLDEGEKSMAGGQSSAYTDGGVGSRSLGIFSTWFQETTAPICFAVTANSLKTLPVEFVNRIEERFFFDLPNEEERVEILKILLAKKDQDPSRFQLAELAEASKNMVGREIFQCLKAALRTSFHKSTTNGLDQTILLEEMKRKPRIFRTMVDELRDVLTWVGYDPDVEDGIRARFASKRRSEIFKEFRLAKND